MLDQPWIDLIDRIGPPAELQEVDPYRRILSRSNSWHEVASTL